MLKRLLAQENLSPTIVLDIGTGTGSSLDILPEDSTLVGLDRSLEMIKRVPSNKHLLCVAGDAYHLPFRIGNISFISAIGLTEYLRDKPAFLDEVKRVLSEGDHFLVTIARPSILSAFRNLLGARIYVIDFSDWEIIAKDKGFICLGHQKTMLQEQMIYETS